MRQITNTSIFGLSWLVVLIVIKSSYARLNEVNGTRQTQRIVKSFHRDNNDSNGNTNSDDDDVHIFIGYKRNVTEGRLKSIVLNRIIGSNGGRIRSRYSSIHAVSATVKRYELFTLRTNPDILYIEDDPIVYPHSEAGLYGLDMVQAQSIKIPTFQGTDYAPCNDVSSFKIGIVDAGLATNHPDIGCSDISKLDSNCIGRGFDIPSQDLWYNPVAKVHGTHVAGTVGATMLNNDGLQGVVNDAKFCFIIGRVFGETDVGTRMSTILNAVQWVASKGSNIINMSLGTGTPSRTARRVMDELYNKGIILVASAGNEGNTNKQFPASYPTVLSIGAVDENRKLATFSQYNNGVDLVAPGVDVLSTVPLSGGSAVFLQSNNISVISEYIQYSIRANVKGILIECPHLGQAMCPGPGNHICLIQRGVTKFEEKALNCQLGGGIGAIIYNDVSGGLIHGGLNENTQTTIPVLDVSRRDGLKLLNNAINSIVTISTRKGYGYLSGTSMSCPHVTGIASLIWRGCRKCTNVQVMDCLKETAVDLGTAGKDQYYGHGLVQAESAYLCLRIRKLCC